MNFARINHILIPTQKTDRDRFRRSRSGQFLMRTFSWLLLFSDEGRWAFLLWLIAGAASLNMGSTQFYYLFSGLSGLLAASLLLARRFTLTDVTIEINAPPRIAVGSEVTFGIRLNNPGQADYQSIRIHTPFLPWDGHWTAPPKGIVHLRAGKTAHCVATAAFSARGPHHLDMFHATRLLPLGLAGGPAIHSRGIRFLVVPRIASVNSIEMPLGVRYQPGGVLLASNTGESREMIGLRPYRIGDPIRDLHYPSWARLGEPVVREYRQEYFTRVGIVVDTDKSVATAARFEASLSLAAGLISHLSRGEALVDLVVLGDRVHQLMVGRNLGFLDQALDLLACAKTAPSWSLANLQKGTLPHLKQLSALFFITLTWDEKRRRLAKWVSTFQVGFRAFEITQNKKETPENPFHKCVEEAEIYREEGVHL